MSNVKSQIQRFKEAARESGADMSKDEFARVIGGLAKPKCPSGDFMSRMNRLSGAPS